MSKRVVICLSHSIEEYDQVRLFHRLGYEVVSLGAYLAPAEANNTKRPPLSGVPTHHEVVNAVRALNAPDWTVAAQEWMPGPVLEWLGDDGVIIYHHYLERLYRQWGRISDWLQGSPGRRVIWRTVGQSVQHNEEQAAPFRESGLEIVRYSPREENIPGYCGADALIRFYKDPEDYCEWLGDQSVVITVSQDLKRRDPWTNWEFWDRATHTLSRRAIGPGSEEIDGTGEVPYEDLLAYLRRARCYLYTGTQPASYTLGLIEAMMTGTPVVSIGASWMRIFPYGHLLFEGDEIAGCGTDDPDVAREYLQRLLDDPCLAGKESARIRARAIDLFGIDKIGAQWLEFLGAP
jgi:hypothetical protein